MPEKGDGGWIVGATLVIGVIALATEGHWKGPDGGGGGPTTGSIHVTVVDSVTGAPIAGQTVSIPARSLSSTTGANGQTQFDGINPGTYQVNVTGTGAYAGATQTAMATVTAGLITSITIPLAAGGGGGPTGIIVVTVVDGGGIGNPPLSGQLANIPSVRGANNWLTTNTNGQVTFLNLAPGSYVVVVRGQGGFGAGSDVFNTVPVSAGGVSRITVQLFNQAGG